MCKAAVLSVGLTVEEDDSPLSDGVSVVLVEKAEVISLSLTALSLSDGGTP